MKTEAMFNAYIEAVYFSDTGDNDQPEANAELTPLFKAQAHNACRNFLYAIRECSDNLDPTQLGHDLWLTRNHHGVGFWARPEIYGTHDAEFFTRLCEAMGEHDAEFIEQVEVTV